MAFDLAIPLPYTCLSLGRYAKLMGISPTFFWQSYTPSLTVFPLAAEDARVWFQHPWQQADRASRSDLALAIENAEDTIADFLGYYPCPRWITNETHQYPRHYNRQAYGYGYNVRGQFKSVKARRAKVITAGQRATTLIATPTTAGGTLVYSDEDADGFFETATVTATTTLTNACELKVYFADQGGEPGWEIRPWRSKSISGGTVTFVFDSWLFIDQDLFETFPTAVEGNDPIDISTTTNYVTSVEVRREYTDTTATSARFFWERQPDLIIDGLCGNCGGTGCVACSLITQDGCLHIRDVRNGTVVPVPASYDSTNAQWSLADWTECREPDQVKIWYQAGDLSERYLADQTCDPLSDFWARVIAWLATARLERSFCATSNATNLADQLQIDLALTGNPTNFNVSPRDLDNPFGTRRGEVQAWKWVSRFGKQHFEGYAI